MPKMQFVSLTSTWFIEPGSEQAAWAAIQELASKVEAGEPGTLSYQVFSQFAGDPRLQSLPPVTPNTVVFEETYASAEAFLEHVNGPIFTTFVEEHGALFVQSNGKPYTTVQFLTHQAGFSRQAPVDAAD